MIPARVTTFERHAGHVTAAGVEARYLVAADGLHSTIRRVLDRETAAPATARARGPPVPRYGLRRHYRVAPWTDLVEVHWTPQAEAYVTPVADDVVGIGLLFARPRPRTRPPEWPRGGDARGERTGTASAATGREAAQAATARRTMRAATSRPGWPTSPRCATASAARPRPATVRGAGPMRQDVRRRVYGRVLLVGDASGYLDALTGEGIGVGLAQAEALAGCLAAGRPADYERAWRRVSGPAWRFTAGLLWSRNQPFLGPRIVPAAQRLPWLFAALVNHAAQA